MCRMVFAKGKFNVNAIIDDVIIMALDQNEKHEENATQQFLHEDGWGICYSEKGTLKVHRSTTAIFEDPDIDIFRNIETDFFILHARKASYGDLSPENVHPFHILKGDEDFYFFHNGTVYDELKFSKQFALRGSTDSERYFYYLLNQKVISAAGLRKKMEQLSHFTGANFILTNGKKTFIANWFAKNPKYYTMKMFSDPHRLLVSSEILPHFRNENWRFLKNKEILTV